MKNVSVVLAYQALERLKEQPMELRSSYQLLKLMQRLREGYQLYCEAEKKLIEDMGLSDKVEDGRIVFGTGTEAVETANKFNAERKLLDDMESEIQIDGKIHICAKSIKINMKDLMALEEYVDFEGMEDDANGTCCSC